jgi:hypothetical protein
MHSQKDRPDFRRLRVRRLGLAALLLGWLLGLALALEHRFAHDGLGHGHEPHLVGGHHPEGDAQCQLVDQAGVGDTLPSVGVAVAVAPKAGLAVDAAVAAAPWPLPACAYEARAPPG